MRSTRWLLVLSVLAASCRGNERPELPLELEWKRSAYRPVLLEGAGGMVVVGERTWFRLYAPDDTFLVAPLYEVGLEPAGMGVVLSATRAVFSRSDSTQTLATDAIVVDLASGVPPTTWSVQLSPGSVPLVADGHWILSSYLDHIGRPMLELVDLDEPSSRFTYRMPGGPGLAIAAQGHMLVFLAGYFASAPGTHQFGWVRVSPELALAGQGFEGEAHPELTDVFEAVVEGDEVLLANVVYGPTDEVPPRIRIARHGLVDGRPQGPPSKAIELEVPLHEYRYSARFAWDGRGTGVLGGMEQLNPCSDVTAYCLATATPAYLVEEGDDGFQARPLLLPYLELDDEASYPFGWARTRTMAVRDGRLLAFQGPPYELVWYRIDAGAP